MDVGTSFEVSSNPANVRVTVATGVVEFGRDGWFDKSINLSEQQAATLDGSGLNRIADVSANNIARWRNEWAEYKGAPLRQVVADLQSLSPKPIEIAEVSLGKKPVSGRIRLTDPVNQLKNLSVIHGFRVRATDDALVITEN